MKVAASINPIHPLSRTETDQAKKECFNVENNEEHSNQIKLCGEAKTGGAYRINTRLERFVFTAALGPATEKGCQTNHDAAQANCSNYIKQKEPL